MIITKALEGLDGVKQAKVSYANKRGEVRYDPAKITPKQIEDKVNQIGFKAKLMEPPASQDARP